jgi:hypothetical protein
MPGSVLPFQCIPASLLRSAMTSDHAAMQRLQKVQPLPATLVTLAALGAAGARLVVQMPDEQHPATVSTASDDSDRQASVATASHHADTLASACRLHDGAAKGGDGGVIKVDALRALSDAKVQCAINPGARSSCCGPCIRARTPPRRRRHE